MISTGLLQINVTDQAGAKEFYVDTLGFELDEEMSRHGVPVLRNGSGAPILLYHVTERVERKYPDETGPLYVFAVEDIDRTYAEWKAKGVEFIPIEWSEEPSGIAPCPFGRFIAFRDPDGNVHEIIQMKS